MIKLIFNPYYDRGVWTPDPGLGKCQTSLKYVGPMGLIDEVSMRLGLNGLEKPRHKILYSWYMAIKDAVATDEAGPFYKDSFEIEPLAVAERLLAWRDSLVMCGWTPETVLPEDLSSNAKAIMEELGSLEQSFRASGCKTFSDKVRDVIAAVPGSGIVPMELESVIPYEALEPVWRNLANLLKDEGWHVTFPKEGKKLPENIKLERFKDYIDACMWVALNRPQDLVICSDAAPLDWTLRALGKPTTGSDSSASNHQIPHMFVDLMQLCCPKYEFSNIISYLSVHPHPLDEYESEGESDKSLCNTLRKKIIREGGLGTCHIEGESAEEIKFWLPFMTPRETVNCDDVIKLAAALGEWAKNKAKVFSEDKYRNDAYAEGLRQLRQTCDVFVSILNLLEYKGKHIGSQELEKLADYAHSPQKVNLHKGEVGAMNVAPGVDSVTAPVGSAVWMDPVPSSSPYPYAFLSDADVEKLQRVMPIPTRSALLVQSKESVNASLSNVGTLTLVMCDKVGTESPLRNQMLVEAIRSAGKVPYVSLDDSSVKHVKQTDPRTQEAKHDMGKGFFEGCFEESMSPSKVERLLDSPFDYVMEKMMGLRGESTSHATTMRGDVSHLIFESIYKEAFKDKDGVCNADQFEKAFHEAYDRIFEAAVRDCGLELCQPESVLSCNSLKSLLKNRSIPAWIKLMRDNKLEIVESELKIKDTIECEGHKTEILLDARIDMLLRDSKGDYVIFDLKHTSSKNSRDKREAQIKNGTDYQLLMYRALVEKQVQTKRRPAGNVRGVGFFMLSTSELLTAYPFEGVKEIEPKLTYEQAYEAFFVKYEAAMSNLHDGILLEGEGMPKEVGGKDDNRYDGNRVLKGKLN